MYVGLPRHLDDLLHIHLPAVVSILDVLCYCAVKQGWFLTDNMYFILHSMYSMMDTRLGHYLYIEKLEAILLS